MQKFKYLMGNDSVCLIFTQNLQIGPVGTDEDTKGY